MHIDSTELWKAMNRNRKPSPRRPWWERLLAALRARFSRHGK
jgi:hypothetical protein